MFAAVEQEAAEAGAAGFEELRTGRRTAKEVDAEFDSLFASGWQPDEDGAAGEPVQVFAKDEREELEASPIAADAERGGALEEPLAAVVADVSLPGGDTPQRMISKRRAHMPSEEAAKEDMRAMNDMEYVTRELQRMTLPRGMEADANGNLIEKSASGRYRSSTTTAEINELAKKVQTKISDLQCDLREF